VVGKFPKHNGNEKKGKAAAKRSASMTSMESLATRFDRVKSRHAPKGVYIKQFGHQETTTSGVVEA
jgi:hypothetical protein